MCAITRKIWQNTNRIRKIVNLYNCIVLQYPVLLILCTVQYCTSLSTFLYIDSTVYIHCTYIVLYMSRPNYDANDALSGATLYSYSILEKIQRLVQTIAHGALSTDTSSFRLRVIGTTHHRAIYIFSTLPCIANPTFLVNP